MPPVLIANTANIPLPDVGPVAVPVGLPVAHLKCFEAYEDKARQIEAGVWECTPGVWKRQVLLAELCHFISGHAYFTPEVGEALEIRAGDAVFFPADSRGTWDVRETIRKTYVTFSA